MFLSFFYLLRQRGLDISPNEWMTLLDGIEKGLHCSSLIGFYQLCRAVLLKSEIEFDRFDQAFTEFFKDVPFNGELPKEFLSWLNTPADDLRRSIEELRAEGGFTDKHMEDLLRGLERRLKEQDDEHNGGRRWIGTQGFTPWGNSGWNPNGIRIGGESMHRTAMSVAGERKFRDFRRDNKLDTRQFQMAFRTLRQLSVQIDSSERELDIDATIHDICENGGLLKMQTRPPRKNNVKVLLLMDSGGSMEYYSNLCSMLFQAATKSNYFKELHTYYFHNSIGSNLYTEPRLWYVDAVSTEWILENFDSSYKVIIVSDAAMNPNELHEKQFVWGTGTYMRSSYEWLLLFRKQYPYLIWLNPETIPEKASYWTQTQVELADIFQMFHLSANGLEAGMKCLLVRQ